MSAYAINAIMKTSGQSGSKLVVLMALADIADDDGIGIMPDMEKFAAKTGMTRTDAVEVISDLINHRYAEIEWWTAEGWQLFRLTSVTSFQETEEDLWAAYLDHTPQPPPIAPDAPIRRPRTTRGKQIIPPELRWAVWERDNFTCRYCGTRQNLSIDHVTPESKGGPTTLDNLQTLCKPCNSRKGDRIPSETLE